MKSVCAGEGLLAQVVPDSCKTPRPVPELVIIMPAPEGGAVAKGIAIVPLEVPRNDAIPAEIATPLPPSIGTHVGVPEEPSPTKMFPRGTVMSGGSAGGVPGNGYIAISSGSRAVASKTHICAI